MIKFLLNIENVLKGVMVEDNHKNIIAAGIFIAVFAVAFLLSEDILKSLVLGILVAIVSEIVLGKYNGSVENSQIPETAGTKTKSEHVENSKKIINGKAVLAGLIVSGILVMAFLTTPPSDGATELSEEASITLTLLLMGSVFMGGALTGYLSYSKEGGLINSIIFTVILGLFMALLSPLMLIFVIPGPIGGIIGPMIRKVLKK